MAAKPVRGVASKLLHPSFWCRCDLDVADEQLFRIREGDDILKFISEHQQCCGVPLQSIGGLKIYGGHKLHHMRARNRQTPQWCTLCMVTHGTPLCLVAVLPALVTASIQCSFDVKHRHPVARLVNQRNNLVIRRRIEYLHNIGEGEGKG